MAHSWQTTSPILDPTTAVNIPPQHVLRSRSLSPRQTTYPASRAYTIVGATQCCVVIGPTGMPSNSSLRSAHPTNSTSDTPSKYISPFISTKSRPSLYQRAISDSPETSTGYRGRSRPRSTTTSPGASAPVLPAPSYVGAMIPPFTGYQRFNEETRQGSDTSSRCSSRASTTHSTTTSSPSGKRGFVAKLKSVLKGGEATETNTIYLTPEEAREREVRIKKAFHGHPISTGGMGI